LQKGRCVVIVLFKCRLNDLTVSHFPLPRFQSPR